MTNIYTGVSGLNSNQNAINISAHNLANIYTLGYVRQQAQFSDKYYSNYPGGSINPMKIGYGVDSARTQHYRDVLIDKAFREQAGRQEFYTAHSDTVDEIEGITGELNGEAFQTSLSDLWSAINEMAKEPDSKVARASLVMHAETFIYRAKEIYAAFGDYQQRLDEKIVSSVDRINQIADQIYEYNRLIQDVEAGGVEQAMDYRDARDVLLDELGSLISIQYKEDENGAVTVRAEGEPFITTGGVFHMEVAQLNGEDGSAFYTPVWSSSGGQPVFNLGVDISTESGTDVGELKGLVKARGEYEATYHDIPRIGDPPSEADFTDENGVLDDAAFQEALDRYWNEEYPAYEEAVREYNAYVESSPIMKAQAMFDQLIHEVVTLINDELCPNTQTTIAAGTTLTIPEGCVYNQLSDEMKAALEQAGITEDDFDEKGVAQTDITFTLQSDMTVTTLDMEKTSYGMDENSTPGTELFSRSDTDSRYTVAVDGEGNKIYLYNPYNQFGDEADYTIANLEINQVVLDNDSFLPFATKDKQVDMQQGQDILDAWENASINLDPSNLTPKDIDDYYTAMTGIIANDGYIYGQIAQNQTTLVDTLESTRNSVIGVSSSDELTNLITFKNAYNANSRYINVIVEMLDTLIQKVGNW